MKRLIPFVLAAAALAGPSIASAGTGTILKVDRGARLVAVTRPHAHVVLVHTASVTRLHVGQRVALRARGLRNGTLAASSVRVTGRARTTRFRALVLGRSHGRLVVSAGGAVIALRSGRATSSAADRAPAQGAEVEIDADVENEALEVEKVEVVAPAAPGGSIEGRITLGTGTITVSDRHMSLVLKVPAGFDLSTFRNGQEVLAAFSQAADGSLTLTRLSGDDDEAEANEPVEANEQGEARGHDEAGDDAGENAGNDTGDDDGGSGSHGGKRG